MKSIALEIRNSCTIYIKSKMKREFDNNIYSNTFIYMFINIEFKVCSELNTNIIIPIIDGKYNHRNARKD